MQEVVEKVVPVVHHDHLALHQMGQRNAAVEVEIGQRLANTETATQNALAQVGAQLQAEGVRQAQIESAVGETQPAVGSQQQALQWSVGAIGTMQQTLADLQKKCDEDRQEGGRWQANTADHLTQMSRRLGGLEIRLAESDSRLGKQSDQNARLEGELREAWESIMEAEGAANRAADQANAALSMMASLQEKVYKMELYSHYYCRFLKNAWSILLDV
jgi:chromosome segregation ATPase